MLKVFDFRKEKIRTVRDESKVAVYTYEIDASILDLPLKDMMATVKNILSASEKDGSKSFMYVKVDVVGNCSKEDIEDLYDIVESALTDIWCTGVASGSDRMGTYMLPDIRMKTSNLLKWFKWQIAWCGLGVEVGKKNSVWKKRMVK